MFDNLDLEAEELLDLVSSNVVKFRKSKGFNQLKLAIEMGYSSASYLGRIEIRKNGEHFNITHLYKISKIFDVPLCEFFKTRSKKPKKQGISTLPSYPNNSPRSN